MNSAGHSSGTTADRAEAPAVAPMVNDAAAAAGAADDAGTAATAGSAGTTGSPAPLTSLTSMLGGTIEGGTSCAADGTCD